VLYEFIAMLVRISFWRANPTFGNFGDKSEVVSVPGALSQVLNEIILPTAKRETSAQFRDTAMKDEGIIRALADGREKLLKWYKDTTGNDEVALPLTPTPTPNPNPNPNPNPTPTPHPNPDPSPHPKLNPTTTPIPNPDPNPSQDETVISDKLGFNEWVRVCDRQDLVGQWEVKQLSEITGDSSVSGTIQARARVRGRVRGRVRVRVSVGHSLTLP